MFTDTHSQCVEGALALPSTTPTGKCGTPSVSPLATTRALLIARREDALDASFPAVMLAPASAICSTSR